MKKRVKKTVQNRKRLEPQKLMAYFLAIILLLGLVSAFTACQKNEGDEELTTVSRPETSLPTEAEQTEAEAESESEIEETSAVVYDPFDKSLIISPNEQRVHYAWPQSLNFFALPKTPEERALIGALLTAPLRAVRDETGLHYVPELLAKLPEISEDGLTLTLTFRNEPLSPEGPIVTAKAYHDYLKEVMSARRHNPLAEAIIDELEIQGALSYYQGAKRNNTNPVELEARRAELLNDLRLSRAQGEGDGELLGLGVFSQEELEEEPIEGSEAVLTRAEDLLAALTEYQRKLRRNLGARINQRVYDSLGSKRPLWATVGIRLLGEEDEPSVLELQLDRPLTHLKIYEALSQFGLLAYRGGLERAEFDPMLDRSLSEDDLSYLHKLGWTCPSVYQIDTITDESLVLKRDPEHLNAGYCLPDVLHFRHYESPKEEMEGFIDGGLDSYYYHGHFDLDRAHPNLRKLPAELWAVYVNCRQERSNLAAPMMTDTRLALARSLDRRSLIQEALPHAEPTTVIISRAVRDPHMPERAFRDVLVAQGNEAPNGGLDRLAAERHFQAALELSGLSELKYRLLYMQGSSELEAVADALKAQWEGAFGSALQIDCVALSRADFWRELSLGAFDLALAPLPQDPFDALSLFAPFADSGYQNTTGYIDENFNALFQEFAAQEGILPAEEWYNGIARLERMLLDEAVIIPLWTSTDYVVMSDQNPDLGESYLPDLDYRSY